MKAILHPLKALAALTLLALAGCSSPSLEKENLAIAAGFKIISPSTPAQTTLLNQLPAGKVTQVNHGGKTYFILPDAPNNQAYVGGPQQYQTFQQLRIARQISNENLMAAQMNQSASMNWGGWGGWGRGWGPGW